MNGIANPRRRPCTRSWGVAAAVMAMACGAPEAGRAEDRATHWLMREPVTLFDLGIFKLRQDLQSAAARMVDLGELPATPLTGAFYDWNRQRIVAYLTLTAGAVQPSEAVCRQAYRATVQALLQGGPSGPRRAETYLENLFLHEGPGNLGRPRDLAGDLVATVELEVTLLPRDLLGKAPLTVKCVGRLDADADEIRTSVRG